MNSIQKYVLNSLFERNQITEEKLAQALDSLSNESAIGSFLSILITGQEKLEEREEFSPEWNMRYHKQFKIYWDPINFSSLKLISIIKKVFEIELRTAKDIVDSSIKEEIIIPREISDSAICFFKHKVKDIKDKLERKGLRVEITTKLN